MTKRFLVYLACPYNDPDPAVKDDRVEISTRAEENLIGRGMTVFNPLRNSRGIDAARTEAEWREYDTAFLERSDGIVVLKVKGWDESEGVAAEIAHALSADLRIWTITPHFDECGGLYDWHIDAADCLTSEIGAAT